MSILYWMNIFILICFAFFELVSYLPSLLFYPCKCEIFACENVSLKHSIFCFSFGVHQTFHCLILYAKFVIVFLAICLSSSFSLSHLQSFNHLKFILCVHIRSLLIYAYQTPIVITCISSLYRIFISKFVNIPIWFRFFISFAWWEMLMFSSK